MPNVIAYNDVMTDQDFMRQALEFAKKSASLGEVPVGALVVSDGQILGASHNYRESQNNPVAHAEIMAIQQAASKLGSWRLLNCTLYVTLEPCAMCAGAIVNSRLSRLVFGANDPKAGAVRSLYQITEDHRLNHQVEVVAGVLAEECGQVLSEFFQKLRNEKKSKN